MALVSQWWHGAAHAPALLQSVECLIVGPSALESLAAWLRRHGRHVRSFIMDCHPGSHADRGPCARELAHCLAALASAGGLQQLELCPHFGDIPLCALEWCAALRQLQSLELASSHVRISSDLAGLTAVTRMALSGCVVTVDAAARLPPNVERFSLQESEYNNGLPRQVSPSACGTAESETRMSECLLRRCMMDIAGAAMSQPH